MVATVAVVSAILLVAGSYFFRKKKVPAPPLAATNPSNWFQRYLKYERFRGLKP